MREVVEYPDRDVLMLDLADALIGELTDYLRRHERASFCVPGGTTPGPIFDVLAAQRIDWERVTVFLNDERWVSDTHPRSNAKLLKERLLVSAASAANFIPLYAPVEPPLVAVDELSKTLAPHLPISVLLLGMGADMHTASLFPGGSNLGAALDPQAPAVMSMEAEAAGETRVTLTGPALNGALSKHIVITGREKREALERAANLSPIEAPIRAVWSDATVHWAP